MFSSRLLGIKDTSLSLECHRPISFSCMCRRSAEERELTMSMKLSMQSFPKISGAAFLWSVSLKDYKKQSFFEVLSLFTTYHLVTASSFSLAMAHLILIYTDDIICYCSELTLIRKSHLKRMRIISFSLFFWSAGEHGICKNNIHIKQQGATLNQQVMYSTYCSFSTFQQKSMSM